MGRVLTHRSHTSSWHAAPSSTPPSRPRPTPNPNPNPNPDPSPDPDPNPNPNPHQVLDAAAPWSPATHALWPLAKRRRASELLRLGQQLSLLPLFAGEEQACEAPRMHHACRERQYA